jgi:uncharacterized protein (TIGR00106 family)
MASRKAVIAEFGVIPVGTGSTSVSDYVAAAVKALKNVKDVKLELTPMGTILEAERLETILEAIRVAHESTFQAGALRVVTVIKIDDRRDVEREMRDKVKAVEEKLKE